MDKLVNYLIFVAFSISIAAYLWKERKKFERHGIIFLRRTKRYVAWIDRVYRSAPIFWRRLSFLFILISFAGIAYSTYWVGWKSIEKIGKGPAISLLLPSVDGSFSSGKGYIMIPLWIWIIGISLIAIPHELFHGIMARAAGIRLRSVGIAFLGIIPGAFVEPDEKQLSNSSLWAKLAVLSAGSGINITIGLLLLLCLWGATSALYVPSGVSYASLIPNSSAWNSSLNGTIIEINGKPVHTVSDMSQIMSSTSPERLIIVKTTKGTYYMYPMNESSRMIIGISGVSTYMKPKIPLSWFPEKLMTLLMWIGIMEIGVGIANLLPIKPLDGGLIVEAIEKELGGSGKISSWVGAMVFMLIVIGVVASFLLPFF